MCQKFVCLQMWNRLSKKLQSSFYNEIMVSNAISEAARVARFAVGFFPLELSFSLALQNFDEGLLFKREKTNSNNLAKLNSPVIAWLTRSVPTKLCHPFELSPFLLNLATNPSYFDFADRVCL